MQRYQIGSFDEAPSSNVTGSVLQLVEPRTAPRIMAWAIPSPTDVRSMRWGGGGGPIPGIEQHYHIFEIEIQASKGQGGWLLEVSLFVLYQLEYIPVSFFVL